jgi:H+/Cl- antiporter ClcA
MDGRPPLTLEQIERDPALRSRDDSGVGAIAVGTVLWLLALAAVAIWGSDWPIDSKRWMLICAIGAGLGAPGMFLVLRRRRRQRASGPDQA